MTYSRQRFWASRTGNVNLVDGGYLVDPLGPYGSALNPDAVPFDAIAATHCLVMLGEPGIGKSHAMRTAREQLRERADPSSDRILAVDLRAFSSEDRLARKLFDSDEYREWRAGTHRLHLFLDSLDECLLRIDTVGALLLDELQQDADRLGRLFIRIACRTAEWPGAHLESGLTDLWGGVNIGVYELLPLRRVDVAIAAGDNGVDPAPFFEEIERKNAVPLAIKPVTLDLLISMYRSRGSLPATQAALYREGLRRLCEESNETYDRAARFRRVSELTAQQRLAVASRIAAVTVFANRYAVWKDVDRGDVLPEDVTIAALSGGSEVASGEPFAVDEAAVSETLGTGLFSARGGHRMGWAHQTYAEFLAADFMVRHDLPLPQRLGLLVHPGDPDCKLAPQLHETAAWAAGMDLAIFRAIADADPDVLLRSDVAAADAGDRARLVGTLLRLMDEGRLFNRDFGRYRSYRKLAHPGLAEQLRPYILAADKGNLVRFEAITIAEACGVRELQDDLAQLALDESQPAEVRAHAASAIADIGDATTKARLRPLALGQAGDDPNDDLKGAGLRATWPGHLSAEELFSTLTPPKRRNLLGAYAVFLSRELVEQLQAADLPTALAWVSRWETRREMPDRFADIADGIMLRAWVHLHDPAVFEGFVRVALARTLHLEVIAGNLDDQPAFRDVLLGDEERRHRVLEALVPLLPDPEHDWILLINSRTPLLVNADLPWLIGRLRAAGTPQAKERWARLVARFVNVSDASLVDAVLIACQDEPALARELAWLITPVGLSSDEARTLKERYLEHQRWQREEEVDDHPLPGPELQHWLERSEAGVLFPAWWNILVALSADPDTGRRAGLFDASVASWPGWAHVDPASRARVVAAAQRYLVAQEPQADDWIATDTYYHADLAAFNAFDLLLQEAPACIVSLPDEVWRRWAPLILAYPTNSSSAAEGGQQALVREAYRHAPGEIPTTLLRLIDKENAQHSRIFITRKLALCWDEPLAAAILAKAQEPTLTPAAMGDLLGELVERNVAGAAAFAESLLRLPLPVDANDRERARVAAHVLLARAQGAGWSSIWPALQHDAAFGRTLVEGVAHSAHWGTADLQQLTEDELADLFTWLARQYPPAEDPQIEEAHAVAPRESVGHWRDAVLETLKARGTERAVAAIRRLIGDLSEIPYLKRSLVIAQETTRRRTWVPPAPGDILALAADRQKRLVRDGRELLAVLVESLQRLQEKLHGETPAVAFIWNEWKQGDKTLFRPKDEERFSDFVKLHLDEDLRGRGVVANREVQIRRGEGSTPGERTDIHVDAIRHLGATGGDHDTITAIIEVKGNWHRELFTAMETQLAGRYLRDNQAHHGLYLVGWFTCSQWDARDSRKRSLQKRNMSVAEAQAHFDAQAVSLTDSGRQIVAVVLNTGLRD